MEEKSTPMCFQVRQPTFDGWSTCGKLGFQAENIAFSNAEEGVQFANFAGTRPVAKTGKQPQTFSSTLRWAIAAFSGLQNLLTLTVDH